MLGTRGLRDEVPGTTYPSVNRLLPMIVPRQTCYGHANDQQRVSPVETQQLQVKSTQ